MKVVFWSSFDHLYGVHKYANGNRMRRSFRWHILTGTSRTRNFSVDLECEEARFATERSDRGEVADYRTDSASENRAKLVGSRAVAAVASPQCGRHSGVH